MNTKFVVFAVLFVVFAASCSKKDDKGQLDPNAMISLRAENSSRASDNPAHLTTREVVEQATSMFFVNPKVYPEVPKLERNFWETLKDIPNERLLMRSTDIIDYWGNWVPDFIDGEDYVITRFIQYQGDDTIAYMKNSAIQAIRDQVRQAYDRGDYSTCYKLFDEAFYFIPITGAEWRVLKQQGLN